MFERRGRQREAGLGSINTVTLVKARGIAASFREILFDGRDPIDMRRAERRARAERKTFGEVADEFLVLKEPGLRNTKHRGHWRMTLEHYAAPLRNVAVADIDTQAVLGVLQPIWQMKPETASRLRARIEAVLDAARVSGHIDKNEANPARWKGHLKKLLQIGPSTSVRVARGAGSRPHLASVLQEGRKSANIRASFGVIWRIPG